MQKKFNKKVAIRTPPIEFQYKLPCSCKMLLESFLATKK